MTKAEQREMDTLRMRVEELRKALALATLADKPEWFNAHVHDPRDENGWCLAATPHRSVRFYDGEDTDRAGHFDVRLGDAGRQGLVASKRLLVMSSSALIVRPSSSNVINIEIDR